MRYSKFFPKVIIPVLIFVFSMVVQSQTVVLNEDFEGGTYVVTPGGTPTWSINSTLQVSGVNSYHNVVALNDSSWVTTDVMDFTGHSFVLLEFQHICKIEFFDAAEILISVDNGTSWTKLTSTEYINNNNSQFATSGDKFTATAYPTAWEASVPAAVPTNSWWRKEQFNLSSIAANQSQVRIKFRLRDMNGNGGNLHAGWYLDDIKLIASPFELIPPTITLNTPIPQDTLFGTGPFPVSAEITDASGISVAYLIYTVNSITDSIIMVNTSGDTYEGTIPSMPLNTHVDWYVSAFDSPPALNNSSTTVRWFYNKKQPAEVIVGTENLVSPTTLYHPVYRFSSTSTTSRSLSVVVYTQAELAAAGIYPGQTITKLAWDKNGAGGTNSALDFKMWMRNSTTTPPLATTTTWQYVLDNFTQVYTNANHSIPAVSGWHEVILTTPFIYTGGSIEVASESFFSGTQPWTSDKFDWKYSAGTATSIIAWTGTIAPTGATILSATVAGYKHRPNTKFFIDATVYPLDAGVIAVTAPTGTQISGVPVPVEVTLRNFGSTILTSADIQFSVNGVPQVAYNWTGSLSEDMVATNINIGNATFVNGLNELKIWSANPNLGLDANNNNDTIVVSLYGCTSILSGIYTIDSLQPTAGTNYQSFEDAFLALTNCGVNGPVEFNVASGTYNTRLVFNGVFPGMSATNTVTFRGTGVSEIFYTTTVSADRAAILLDGAKHLRFDNMTITIPDASGFGHGIHMINQADDIQITNCTVNVHTSSTLTNYSGIVASGSLTSAITTGNTVHNLLLENNTVNGGYYGIVVYGQTTTPLNGIVVRGNTLNESHYYGLRVQYTNELLIDGNTLNARVTGGTAFHYGLYIGYTYQPIVITNNYINNSGGYGAYFTNVNTTSRSLFANNSIGGFRGTGTPYGIYLTTSSNIDFLYNSVNVNSGNGRCFHTLTSATGLVLKNNSFVYSATGTGYAMYNTGTTSIIEQDHNNYFSAGSNFVYHGSAVANLAALQAVNVPAGNDLNSVSGNPIYLSDVDLHPLGAILNNVGTPIASITTDIEGNLRDAVTPDIGAYEYVPVAGDFQISDAKLVRGLCLSNNDSLYVSFENIIGNTVDFSINPLTIVWAITGPVNSNNTIVVNSGTLAVGTQMEIGIAGIDLSLPGTYNLNVHLLDNAVNTFLLNDTLPTIVLTVDDYLFDATPNYVLIMTPADTVEMSVNSNLFPGGGLFITEICHWRASSTGVPSGGWPSYLIADDYIEITGSPNTDISGYILEMWSSSSMTTSNVLGAGTVIGPNGTCIIATGQLGSSIPSPANYYFHSGYTGTMGSTTAQGYILKNTSNEIVDAAVYGNLTFPVAAGVGIEHWSGTTPAISSAGNRLEGPYTKDATNWINSGVSPQNPNLINNNVVLPTADSLSGFSWSLGGIVTSVNSIDTVVGPWITNGLYEYVATYVTPCGVFTDTVKIDVNIPLANLILTETAGIDDNVCYIGTDEFPSIRVSNTGIDTVFTFTASYSIDGDTPVNEIVNTSLAPNDTIDYVFITPINFGLITDDTTFVLTVYVNHPQDIYNDSDTLHVSYTFQFIPDVPIVQHDVVNYGQSATLIAESNGDIFWYADSLTVTPLAFGDTLHTPLLFADQTYWAQAVNGTDAQTVQVGTSTTTNSTTGITPFSSGYEGARIQYLFRADELTALGLTAGNISALSFNVTTSGVGTHPQRDYTIKMAHTSDLAFSGNYATPSSAFTTVYFNASEPAPAVGLKEFQFSSGFFWDGVSNILIDICHENDNDGTCGTCYSGNSTVRVSTTTFNSVYGRYNDNAPACNVSPSLSISTFTSRPNIIFEKTGNACVSVRVPVHATVNLPQFEPEIISIVEPISEGCSDNANVVSIEITNNGSDTITSGLTASYQIQGGTPIAENVTTPVAPGDTILFAFVTPFALNLTTGDSTIMITSWVNHPSDSYNLNDTTSRSATLGFTAPMPLADNDTIPYATQATLVATSPYMLSWYDSPISTTVLDTGSVFVSPVLYANTAYYVGASESSNVSEHMGMTNAVSTTSFISSVVGWGLFFSNDETIVIDTVHVYPTGTGTITIQILDSLTNTILFTGPTVSLTGDGSNNPTNKFPVEVDLEIPAGTYKIGMTYTGITNLIREISGATHPYVSPSTFARITAGATGGASPSTGTYYWFYDWVISTPGIGCESPRVEVWAIIDTLTVPNVDAGVVSVDEPLSPANLQPNVVKVTIQNYGSDPLTTVDIAWTINGIVQPTYTWNGLLNQGDIMTDVNIGTASFFLGQNDMLVWTENPNGVNDLINVNDTAYYTLEAFEPLCGTYQIGGTNPDFANFSQAVYGLQNWGISCPVTFIVEPGTYYEQIRINEISGADATNTITFIGNNNPVLSFAPSISAERYVVKLDSAKHIRFENMTIEAENSATYGFVVHMMNGCDDIEFTNCVINTNTNSTSTFFAGIVASGNATSATTGGPGVSNLTIDECTINGGYYGVVLYGQAANPMNNNRILNTEFNNQYYYGAYLAYNQSPIISGNTFNGKIGTPTTVSSRAIHFLTAYGPWEITKNVIINQGIYGIYMSGSSSATTPSLIANNMIGGGFTSTSTIASGMYITSSNNMNIWFNSVLFDGTAGRTVYLLSGLTNIDFRNNSMAFTGTGAGYAYYAVSTTMFTEHNYNNYYSTGTNFVYYGAARADLAALQAVNQPIGNDANSQVGNPFYYSSTDLHASTTQLWASGTPIAAIVDDIDGDLRDPIAPAIGADEYLPAAIDAAVVAGLEPSAGCGLTATELISVRIKNMGLDTLFTMNISYSINGATPVSEIWNDTLIVGDYLEYTFTQTADLSAPGTYNIFFEVDAAGDAIAFNDTLTYSVRTGHDFYAGDYFMGFEVGEDYSQWTVVDVNSDNRTWEPGYVSTTYARTGARSARFFNNSAMPGNDYLFTECFYLEAGTAYKVEFWYRVESVTYPQNTDLVVATDVLPSAIIDTLAQVQMFTNNTYQMSSGIFTPTVDGIYYFGWYAYSPAANWYSYIDDINIRILAPQDAGAISVDNVDDMEDGGSTINPEVTIKNFGSQTLTSVPVSYSVNGGAWVTETWTGSIDADETDFYVFTAPFTVPDGNYTLCVRTELSGDGNPGNDQTCVNKYGLPVLSLPHFDDLEGTQFWYVEGTGNQWQYGIPSASLINNAYSPVNVWATVLAGNYANNSSYYLYTPKFNFSNVNNMMLGFWHWMESETGVDGGKIQYSSNGGATWLTLGILNDPNGTNWYNTANINNAPGFSGSTGGWVYSEISLAAFDYFPLPVQFRFHFYSNATTTNNGWALDNFEIYQPQIPLDAGVIAIEAPVGQSVTGGSNQVTVRLKNFGTQTLTSIPVTYRVLTGAPPVNGTWTGTLAPDAETSFTFTTPFTGPFQSSYGLCAWTNLAGDTYSFNDTTCVTLNAGPANIDGAVVAILSPSGPTVAGTNVPVTIRVKNLGLQPLTNIPVQFLLNGTPQTTESVIGTLAPGDSTQYTFITTFVSPSTDYQLCAKTSVAGDAIISNDQICLDLTTGIGELEIDGIVLLQNVPNPATDETMIGFSLPSGGQLLFSVTNVLGEVIYSETSDYAPGKHTIMVNTKSMAAGVYYYSVTFNQTKLTRKMIVQ